MSERIVSRSGRKAVVSTNPERVPSWKRSRRFGALSAAALAIGLFAGVTASPAAAQYRLSFFDAPDATITFARGINNHGQIAGTYTDTNFETNGFVFDGQNFTIVRGPNAFTTELNDINDAGTTVGSYVSFDDFSTHNFVSSGAGLTDMDFPGAASTTLQGINNLGHITGSYTELGDSQSHGFVFNGTDFISFDAPGTRSNVFTGGLNDLGTVVGTYFDTAFHGFTITLNGLTTLDIPGATDTFVSDINNRGDIVGFYETGSNDPRTGFVMRDGQWTPLAIPGASFTNLMGINDNGVIVGYYADANDRIHGFTATPVPEPTLGLWLIAAGLSGGLTWRRERNRSRARGREDDSV
jgi:uncharacterized membrane protein